MNSKNGSGYIRVAACSPEVRVADIRENIAHINACVSECAASGVDIAVFPELCLTGYSCGDLFDNRLLLDKAEESLSVIGKGVEGAGRMTIIVGVPIEHDGSLYNCAAVLHDGHVAGIVPKSYLPNYNEFYERRWFRPGSSIGKGVKHIIYADGERTEVPIGTGLLFEHRGVRFGIEICEDLWVPSPPGVRQALNGAEIIFNLSATNDLIGKHDYLADMIRNQSARLRCGYVYASSGTGESSTDLAFGGNCIIAADGKMLAESRRFTIGPKIATATIDVEHLRHDRRHFSTFGDCLDAHADTHGRTSDCGEEFFVVPVTGDVREDNEFADMETYIATLNVDAHPFVDPDPAGMADRCSEITSIQSWGLAMRLRAINCKHAVVGISGGLDSTLALLVTVKAFDMLGLDRKGITGITMPGYGTTARTKSNASLLMEHLGVTEREIPIGEAVAHHFAAIGHDPQVHDVTYENSQARERTQILMDVANQVNGLVIGTGDLSELALGWCTYNGDQMSMYGVNASIPKTLVRYLVEGHAAEAGDPELARVLRDIIDTPISPELLPPTADDGIEQKTEHLVGPYELHDFFIYHTLRHGSAPRKVYLLAAKAFEGKYDRETILRWLRKFYHRFFTQQFKRSCMPDGVKAGSVCLSPRGDWRMPSDASAHMWLEEVDRLKDEIC